MAKQLVLYGDASGIINADTNNSPNSVVQRGNDGSIAVGTVTTPKVSTSAVVAGLAAKTANYTLTAADWLVTFDATSGNLVATLPSVAAAAGQILTVKKIDASGNTVTVTPAGAETIDGSATKVISARWSSYTVQSDGVSWQILAKI